MVEMISRGTGRNTALLVLVLLCLRSLSALSSDHHELHAVPCPGPVVIDGRLDDWDRSGQILLCSDLERLLTTHSGQVAMMYDQEALYVAVDWLDPTPMVNDYHPGLDVDRRLCFHGDSLQILFRTDQVRQVFAWHYTRADAPGVTVTDGKRWWKEDPIRYIDGLTELGISLAFTKKADGQGYVQEMRIPWTAVVASGRAYQPGESFDCMLDLVWGPLSGKGWPENHIIDLVAPGAVHTGWFWEVNDIYGRVVLSEHGQLDLPEPAFMKQLEEEQAAVDDGVVPIRVAVAEPGATHITVAINDASGKRVRNLIGDIPIAEHLVADAQEVIEVHWDCLDDQGRTVVPGDYQVVGLTHGPLDARFDMTFYNPGTPAWKVGDGTGAWGADHGPPSHVARSGSYMAVAWHGAEGGSGLLGLNDAGQKIWGERQGASALAGDEDYVYSLLNDPWSGKKGLARLRNSDGAYQPYTIDGREYYPVPMAMLFPEAEDGTVTGMGVAQGRLFLAHSSGVVAIFDAAGAQRLGAVALEAPGDLACAADGSCYAIAGQAVLRLDLEHGRHTQMVTPGLVAPRALSIDSDGNLVVVDMGPDSQVKAYSVDGELVYTVGRQGGRPSRGAFDATAMLHVSSVAVDGRGQIWTTEQWDYPRRVAVWGRDGSLQREYLGNSHYAASDTYLHDQHPGLAYAGTVEITLDRPAHAWAVSQILWAPPEGAFAETWPAAAYKPGHLQRLTSAASGSPREYLYARKSRGEDRHHAVFMQRNGRWQCVAAVLDKAFWNDDNRDGIRQEAEIIDGGGRIGGWWGTRIGQDLSIYTDGVMRYAPVGFTDDGAPIYGPAGMRQLASDRGDMVPIDGEDMVIVASHTGWGKQSWIRALHIETGEELWRYPAPFYGVHGSHRAPMPKPGELFGGLKAMGYARIADDLTIYAIRSNLGSDHFLTTDGMYVASLFRDHRIPGAHLPRSEAEARGMSVAQLSQGGEPFSGWFGKQSDGTVRLITSMARQAGSIVEVTGLESVRRFTGPTLTIDKATLVAAEAHNQERHSRTAAKPRLTVSACTTAPTIDGNADDWKGIKPVTIARQGFPERGKARLAYDAEHLYVMAEVTDASPWVNAGKDHRLLFKTGDAIDLQLETRPGTGSEVGADQSRLLFAAFAGEPVCVLMRPHDADADANLAHEFASPIGKRSFDRVELRPDVRIAVSQHAKGYTLEAAIPLALLGLEARSGLEIRGDLGFISSDAQGQANVARTYWANAATNLVSDLPTESWLYPGSWGTWAFE